MLRWERLSQLSSPPLKVVLSDSWGCLRTRWPLEGRGQEDARGQVRPPLQAHPTVP